MKAQTLKAKTTFGAIVLGVLVALATGLLPNESGMSIPEVKRYGHPVCWFITNLNGPTEYVITNLAIDIAFWFAVSLLASLVLKRVVKLEIAANYKTMLWALVLAIPLGFVMCFIHELGHAMLGTLAGGRLIYIQIAYLIISPSGITMTPHFRLGAAAVDGLTYGSLGYGLMLLGGSMMTSIASWIIGIALHKASFSSRIQVALKTLGLWGILDLPFYVVFPQMGLGHWIFLGGRGPEPLTGTRMIGIPDLVFYLAVVFSTIGLISLYFRPICEKAFKETKAMLETFKTQRIRRALFGSILCGAFLTTATGVIRNPPEASIIGATYYGYPIVWRVVKSTLHSATDYHVINFAIDTIFWMILSFLAWILVQKIAMPSPQTSESHNDVDSE